MSFQAYIDNVKTKTGKSPEDFARLAVKRRLSKHGEIVAWLKSEFGLGHGHANAIAGIILRAGMPKPTGEEKFAILFGERKEHWRQPAQNLIARVLRFGSEVSVSSGGTYVSLIRAGKKFGILQPSSVDRLDIGIKLKGHPAEGRFEPAGAWNAMVTHRVRIAEPRQIDSELLSWLKRAYEAASREPAGL